MKIINTVKPDRYYSSNGGGLNHYRYIDFVELKENKVTISILEPDTGTSGKRTEVVLIDPTIIEILPSLLGGEISGYQAYERLEEFLGFKHKELLDSAASWHSYLQSNDIKDRVFALYNCLISNEPFVRLCQLFPTNRQNASKLVQDIPFKVVSEEIIEAIKSQKKSTTPVAGGKNRIDGVNMRRGEGLPYSEEPVRSQTQPFISHILASRHPVLNNNIDGVNKQRGEGLPYSDVQVVDNNIEIDLSSTSKNGL